jgi:hypothetical protein
MNHVRSVPPLTDVELAVLARLSRPPKDRQVTDSELAKAIIKLSDEGTPPPTLQELQAMLDGLCARSFATLAVPAKGRSKRRWCLTQRGATLLQHLLGMESLPTWSQIYQVYLPALELGLEITTERIRKPLRITEIRAAIVSTRLKIPHELPNLGIMEALILDELQMSPGPVTLASICSHLLIRRSRRNGINISQAFRLEGAKKAKKNKKAINLDNLIPTSAMDLLAVPKDVAVAALARRGLSKLRSAQLNSERSGDTPPPISELQAGDPVLTAIHEAIPHIGKDGRHGPEKVFVSALWHRVEHDHRLNDLSYERFKRWLVDANRERLLDLASADVTGAMNPRLVAESEIRDFGTTFHFVLDQQASLFGANLGIHARKA